MEIKTQFFNACDEQFSFLKRFAFKPKAKKIEAGTFLRVFQNNMTAVEVALEWPEQYLYVRLCRLVDGRIKENPTVIRPNSKLYCFNLENLLVLKAPHLIAAAGIHKKMTTPQMEATLRTYADAVETYASEILQGDFAVFSQLDGIVKERVARSSQELSSEQLAA